MLSATIFNANIFASYTPESTTIAYNAEANDDSNSLTRGFDKTYKVTVSQNSSTAFMSDINLWSERSVKVNYCDKLSTNFQSIRVRVEGKSKNNMGTTWEEVGTQLIYLGSSYTFTLPYYVYGCEFRVFAYMDSNISGTVEIRVVLS